MVLHASGDLLNPLGFSLEFPSFQLSGLVEDAVLGEQRRLPLLGARGLPAQAPGESPSLQLGELLGHLDTQGEVLLSGGTVLDLRVPGSCTPCPDPVHLWV